MLSKQTRHLLSNFLRVSSQVKVSTKVPLTPLYSGLTSFPNPALHHFTQSYFSNTNKDDSNSQDPTDPAENKAKNAATSKAKASEKIASADEKNNASDDEGDHYNGKEESRKLLTVPLKPMKFPLEKGEEKLKQETFVLFSSSTPIIPHSQQTGFVRTGNLGAEHISKKLAFFIQNDAGEIYTIGLVLENNVNKALKKDISKTSGHDEEADLEVAVEDDKSHKANISTKPSNYKIKLTEIEFKDNCIFAKGIPYKDRKPTAAEKEIKVQSILVQIKNLILSIKQSVSHEKIDVFNGLSFDSIYSKNIEPEKLDELLCNILGECQKLANHTKEPLQPFIQAFLEQRSQVSRMFMIKKKLEEFKNVLEIVNKSIQFADEQIWKFHEQTKARLSLDYIRSNYFTADNPPPGAKAGASQQNAQGTPLSGQAKKFMEKLHLIKDEVSRDKIKKEIERFNLQDKTSGEYHKLYTYLDEVFSIPWEKISDEYWDIEYSKQQLENRLFGLDKVKERIIEMIAVNKLKRVYEKNTDKKKGFVILLNGPPGTGKTTIAKAIAAALKRESRFISFAGVTDPAFVKGHKRTYLDAQPGIFVKELIKSKVMNPVFILDEVDKLSKHFQGVDPYYALMEILNPEENHNFTDHYLDVKVDFSQVVFILTANQVLNMLEPLRNRLEIIEVPSYIEQEKLIIAKKYLIPEVLKEHGLPSNTITFDDETISRIIKGWCYYESGVRELRRCFEKIARKQALEILNIHRKEHPPAPVDYSNDDHPVRSKFPPTLDIGSTPLKEEATFSSVEAAPVKEVHHLEAGSQQGGLNLAHSAAAGSGVSSGSGANSAASNSKKDSKEATAQEEKDVKKDRAAEEARQLIDLKNQTKLVFDSKNDPEDEVLKKYLGNPVFDDMYERRMRKPFLGSANVLTVSGFIGHVMTVECIYDLSSNEKKGMLNSSGNLQKVLQESLTIARLVAFKYLPDEKIKEIAEKNVHVHFLQGGTPKDGPSAGLSICSAFLSLMLNKPIPQDLSMTGELSLNGDVCKIGGVQAKVTASKALDINRIILPWGNKTEFVELPKMLKEGLTVYFVKEYKEVYDIVFGENEEALKSIERCINGKFIEPVRPVGIPTGTILSSVRDS